MNSVNYIVEFNFIDLPTTSTKSYQIFYKLEIWHENSTKCMLNADLKNKGLTAAQRRRASLKRMVPDNS